MDGFSLRTEQKKRLILDAAQKRLFNGTYKTSTVSEIAKEARVSQVSIYNYFGSKDDLLFAALSRVLDEKLREYYDLLHGKVEFKQLVHTILNSEMKLIQLVRTWTCQAVNINTINVRLKEYQNIKLAAFLMEFIHKGKNEGCVSPDLTDSEIRFYFHMYQQAMAQLQDEHDLADHVISEERLIAFFFHGLMGRQ